MKENSQCTRKGDRTSETWHKSTQPAGGRAPSCKPREGLPSVAPQVACGGPRRRPPGPQRPGRWVAPWPAGARWVVGAATIPPRPRPTGCRQQGAKSGDLPRPRATCGEVRGCWGHRPRPTCPVEPKGTLWGRCLSTQLRTRRPPPGAPSSACGAHSAGRTHARAAWGGPALPPHSTPHGPFGVPTPLKAARHPARAPLGPEGPGEGQGCAR